VYKPSLIYAELFQTVQLAKVFDDSKIFVDAIPKRDGKKILDSYHDQRTQPGFDLRDFVKKNFVLPESKNELAGFDHELSVRQAINGLWDALTRQKKSDEPQSSLITLPQPFIMPGGRFREIYYWDSYFTMLGLAESGRMTLVENMVTNFAFLIDEVGFIPNGNRSYYCTRSQMPLFALMIELLAENKQDQQIYVEFLPQLEKEYAFWMLGAESLERTGDAFRRVIKVDGGYLNRYWDDSSSPRAESYAEDVALVTTTDRVAHELFRDVRAACESGWDFCSRWFEDGRSMSSINTTQIIPVDLNAMMYKMETVLAKAYTIAGDHETAGDLNHRAQQRRVLIQSLFFDQERNFFVDLKLSDLSPSHSLSLAAVVPLVFNIATKEQAASVTEKINKKFLKSGGWVTTLVESGQQWDAPNGWAPLQWMTYAGLRNYGFAAEAKEGASRWVENNIDVFHSTGKFWEKYNVEKLGLSGEGGEYRVQDGFGWTNGVLLKLMNELGVAEP
jgi:alpha,alpha-trehalase